MGLESHEKCWIEIIRIMVSETKCEISEHKNRVFLRYPDPCEKGPGRTR